MRPKYCYIKNCKDESNTNRSFHRLPFSQPMVLQQWIRNIGADHNIMEKKGFQICSKHFEESCFDRTGQTTRLKLNSVPTLFLGEQRIVENFSKDSISICGTPRRKIYTKPKKRIFEWHDAKKAKQIKVEHSYVKEETDYKQLYFIVKEELTRLKKEKNIFGKNYKAPLSTKNEHYWRPFLEQCFQYIQSLKLANGSYVIKSNRKTGFLGLLILIESSKCVYDKTVNCEQPLLDYLLTYKQSQDHLELFFSSIRSRLGFNDNPTAKQFIAAFKRLLIRHELKHVNSNCMALDNTSILNVTSDVTNHCNSRSNCLPDGLLLFSHNSNENKMGDHYYCHLSTLFLSDIVHDIVEYIAGFIVKKMIKIIQCQTCAAALTCVNVDSRLITFKNRGGLVYPSLDVIKICRQAEVHCRRLLNVTNNCLSVGNIFDSLVDTVYANLPENVFYCLNDHIFEFETFGINHVCQLTKTLIAKYLKIRIHHTNRRFNIKSESVRQKLHKVILFKHQ